MAGRGVTTCLLGKRGLGWSGLAHTSGSGHLAPRQRCPRGFWAPKVAGPTSPVAPQPGSREERRGPSGHVGAGLPAGGVRVTDVPGSAFGGVSRRTFPRGPFTTLSRAWASSLCGACQLASHQGPCFPLTPGGSVWGPEASGHSLGLPRLTVMGAPLNPLSAPSLDSLWVLGCFHSMTWGTPHVPHLHFRDP